MIDRSDYEKAINWLYDLQFFGMKLGLSNTLALLEELGNPHEKFRSIHVAGTNGKGSVCAFLTRILEAEGLKVGTYTSPHLNHFGERITVNGFPMTRTDAARAVQHTRPKIEKLREEDVQCTFFEAATCMAFHHFARRRVDIAVVEVGMGGRLDSTNVINPELAVITNISREHSQHLGETIEEIAGEKAGIIKEGVPVVTSATGKALSVIHDRCRETGSELHDMNTMVELGISHAGLHGSSLRMRFRSNDIRADIRLAGLHQARNAATAALAADIFGAGASSIREGLEDAEWPGRLSIVRKRPTVILDSTHNPGGAEALAGFLREQDLSPVLVIGMLEDKEAGPVVRSLEPLAKRIIVTEPHYERKMRSKDLAALFSTDIVEIPDIEKALERGFEIAGLDELILVTGSIFTASDALSFLDRLRINEILDTLGGMHGIGAYPGRDPETDGPPPPGSRDPFRVLISTILSQRTKDENTHLATEQLFSRFDTPEKLASVEPERIHDLIRPAGFYKQKAEKIVQTSKIVHEAYGSRVPDTMEELVSLPGVGRKTASCVLAYGFGKPAIAVDTHVHRICNLLGLVKTARPDDTEEALMFLVPQERWHDVNRLLVRHGQSICRPTGPQCSRCPVSHLCYHGIHSLRD